MHFLFLLFLPLRGEKKKKQIITTKTDSVENNIGTNAPSLLGPLLSKIIFYLKLIVDRWKKLQHSLTGSADDNNK